MARKSIVIAGVFFMAVWLTPIGALGAVRVVDDEVFFTLSAPGANKVYLVGDFNNWNPTVESMPREGDVFEISLYLVEGTYRYKFVVDGKWIVDPDNPGRNPAKGSPLVLVEKPAGLALNTMVVEKEVKLQTLFPSVRYIGDFRWDDEEFESDHMVDLGISVEKDNLNAWFLLKTAESSRDPGETKIDVSVDRGYVETRGAGLHLRAFDNDSVWTSAGPLGLIGNHGVYGYNAGFDRMGVAVEFPLSEAIMIRGMYADHDQDSCRSDKGISRGYMPDFPGDKRRDFTQYYYDTDPRGSDVFAFETYLDAEAFQLGYASRRNHGIHQGLFTEYWRTDSLYERTVYGTHENSAVSEYWLKAKGIFRTDVTFGYGSGEANVVFRDRGSGATDFPSFYEGLEMLRRLDAPDRDYRFLSSSRFAGAIDFQSERLAVSAGWQRTSFEFADVISSPAKAVVNRGTLEASYKRFPWSISGVVRHTDQKYSGAPLDFLIDSPRYNVWLDGRDTFDIGDIAALGLPVYSDAEIAVTWEVKPNDDPDSRRRLWLPSSARLTAEVTTEDILGEILYKSARLKLEKVFLGRYVLQADGRVASYGERRARPWYHDPTWGAETFTQGYVEMGYRTPRYQFNVGYGFDPMVFDPVVNEYQDIGRTDFLRQALGVGSRRDLSAAVVDELLGQERELEQAGILKVECIVRF